MEITLTQREVEDKAITFYRRLECLQCNIRYLSGADQQMKTGTYRKEHLMSDVTELMDDFEAIMQHLGVSSKKTQPKNFNLKRKRIKDEDEFSSDGSVCGIPCSKRFPCQKNDVHQDTLIDTHTELMKDLHLDDDLLDRLIETDVISHSDRESILSEKTDKKKNRKLLLTLSRYGKSKFDNFMGSLKQEHGHLHKVLQENKHKIEIETERRNSIKYNCIVCKIAKNVDVEDVVDNLYKHRVLSTYSMEKLLSEQNKKKAWSHIFTGLKRKNNGNMLLGETLNKKYPEFAQALIEIPESLQCRCKSVQQGNHDMTEVKHFCDSCCREDQTEVKHFCDSCYREDQTEVKRFYDSCNREDQTKVKHFCESCYREDQTEVKQICNRGSKKGKDLNVCGNVTYSDSYNFEESLHENCYSDMDEESDDCFNAWDNPTYFCQKTCRLISVSSDEGIVPDVFDRHRFNRKAIKKKS